MIMISRIILLSELIKCSIHVWGKEMSHPPGGDKDIEILNLKRENQIFNARLYELEKTVDNLNLRLIGVKKHNKEVFEVVKIHSENFEKINKNEESIDVKIDLINLNVEKNYRDIEKCKDKLAYIEQELILLTNMFSNMRI